MQAQPESSVQVVHGTDIQESVALESLGATVVGSGERVPLEDFVVVFRVLFCTP